MGASAYQLEHVTTADGARLALKRRPCPGGPPVLLIHGIAVNADLWDMRDVATPEYTYRSLSSVLHEAGYDLYLLNLRGHGAPHMPSTPPPEQRDWCVDHFILYDLPAAIGWVRAQTGQRPFVIAASMGAMSLAGYLQGARLTDGPAPRVTVDGARAARRQAEIAGAIFAEFPAALRWPASCYTPDGRLDWAALVRGWRRTDGGANFPFELASRLGWLRALVDALGRLPLTRLAPRETPWYSGLPKPVAERVADWELAVARAGLQLAGTFTGTSQLRAEVLLKARRYIMADVQSGVLRQLADSVRAGSFVSGIGAPRHDYTAGYGQITVPLLVLAGGCDRIASAAVTREVFFDRAASRDKTFLLYEEISHGEIEAAPLAAQRVYPDVLGWLRARAVLCGA